MEKVLSNIKKTLIQARKIIYPHLCLLCDDLSQADFCEVCASLLQEASNPLCVHCGRPFKSQAQEDHLCGSCILKPPAFDQHRSSFVYDEAIVKILYRFKEKGHLYFLDWMHRELRLTLERSGFFYDWVVPIPISLDTLKRRQMNPSLELAKGLKIPIAHGFLKKSGVMPQKGLTRKERLRNMKGAFEWKGAFFEGQSVLIVDDVFTTGATLNEAAWALKKVGAGRVYGVTLAVKV